jgi:transcriptional regulator PpsR
VAGGNADALQQNLNHFYESGVDAIIFASQDGDFLSANDSFLKMASVAQAQSLKGRSVSEFLGRGAVDLKVILENTARTGSIRMYSTRIKGEHGTERSVEISSSALGAGDEMVFALLIRDTNRMETSKTAPNVRQEVDMRSVIELIGSQSLKSIVSRTTDVVEKMCIETAVEMTSNNRVAAAEMLGLSRQSLYVKLRKYGLLERSP